MLHMITKCFCVTKNVYVFPECAYYYESQTTQICDLLLLVIVVQEALPYPSLCVSHISQHCRLGNPAPNFLPSTPPMHTLGVTSGQCVGVGQEYPDRLRLSLMNSPDLVGLGWCAVFSQSPHKCGSQSD